MLGFLGKKLYAIRPVIIFTRKLPKLLCLECSIWQMFLSSSFTVSITDRFLSSILSLIVINEFFILFLTDVINWMPSTNKTYSLDLSASHMLVIVVNF